MIVIFTKAEIARMRKLKAQGKGDKVIMASMLTGSKFDIRDAGDIDLTNLKPMDLSKEFGAEAMKEAKDGN